MTTNHLHNSPSHWRSISLATYITNSPPTHHRIMAAITEAQIEELSSKLRCRIVTPSSEDYAASIARWSDYSERPAVSPNSFSFFSASAASYWHDRAQLSLLKPPMMSPPRCCSPKATASTLPSAAGAIPAAELPPLPAGL